MWWEIKWQIQMHLTMLPAQIVCSAWYTSISQTSVHFIPFCCKCSCESTVRCFLQKWCKCFQSKKHMSLSSWGRMSLREKWGVNLFLANYCCQCQSLILLVLYTAAFSRSLFIMFMSLHFQSLFLCWQLF